MRKLLFPLAIVFGVLLCIAYVFRAPLSVKVAERIAPGMLATDILPGLPDGLHVALCGAGSPFPDPQRAGPCTVVVAGRGVSVPGRDELLSRAHFIEERLGLPATKWLRMIRPL